MIASLQKINTVITNEVDNAVFLSEPSGPCVGEAFQRFRFTGAGEGIPMYYFIHYI
jgi:hypothetical protein